VFHGLDAPSVLTDLSTLISSYEQSTVPIIYFHQPEQKCLHQVGSGSVCAMNVPNYYERNLRSRAWSDMTTRLGVLLSYSATHSTHGSFFLVRCGSFNRFRVCALKPTTGDDYPGLTLV